jgi:hypothetical protein
MDSFDPAILDAPTIVGSNSQDSAMTFPGSGESALHGGAKLIFKTSCQARHRAGFFCCGPAIFGYQMPIIY